ncbi:hypothetical protein R3P38DRAFT_3610189 [Favolaschia claudopus]|uniref:Uncharacterized protein n=1 Tax=Favolaschia claudopus TaxID=2862362 RepID=A0AAW0A781_9AGAR
MRIHTCTNGRVYTESFSRPPSRLRRVFQAGEKSLRTLAAGPHPPRLRTRNSKATQDLHPRASLIAHPNPYRISNLLYSSSTHPRVHPSRCHHHPSSSPSFRALSSPTRDNESSTQANAQCERGRGTPPRHSHEAFRERACLGRCDENESSQTVSSSIRIRIRIHSLNLYADVSTAEAYTRITHPPPPHGWLDEENRPNESRSSCHEGQTERSAETTLTSSRREASVVVTEIVEAAPASIPRLPHRPPHLTVTIAPTPLRRHHLRLLRSDTTTAPSPFTSHPPLSTDGFGAILNAIPRWHPPRTVLGCCEMQDVGDERWQRGRWDECVIWGDDSRDGDRSMPLAYPSTASLLWKPGRRRQRRLVGNVVCLKAGKSLIGSGDDRQAAAGGRRERHVIAGEDIPSSSDENSK